MFTGIIYQMAEFLSLNRSGNFIKLNIKINNFPSPKIGESVAVDGACLTLANYDNDIYSFDISNETLQRTIFSKKKQGDLLNIERSLRIGDDISGHFVYGHIDTIGKLNNIYKYPSNIIFRFSVDKSSPYLVEKGSIAINGVSLTISKIISPTLFEISIIPETLKNTNLNFLKIGHYVNIEYDMLAKYVLGVLKNVKYH